MPLVLVVPHESCVRSTVVLLSSMLLSPFQLTAQEGSEAASTCCDPSELDKDEDQPVAFCKVFNQPPLLLLRQEDCREMRPFVLSAEIPVERTFIHFRTSAALRKRARSI